MSGPVDVLAVLDAEIACAREAERSAEDRGAAFGVIDPIRVRVARLEKARAAVAELIEALEGMVSIHDSVTMRQGIERRNEGLPKARAALSNITGAKS